MLDLWRRKLTPRKAATLAVNLPAGAVTWHAAGVDASWSPAEFLLAQAVDALQGANWQRGGGKESDRPKPLPRPAEVAERAARESRVIERARAFKARQQQSGGDDG